MTRSSPKTRGARRWLVASLALAALMLAAPGVHAAPYTFATFNVPTDGQPFSFTNNADGTATIKDTNTPVTFNFTAPTGLGTQDRSAFLNIEPVGSVSAVGPASLGVVSLDQEINLLNKLTLTSGTNGTGTNFLTLFFTGDLLGIATGSSGNVIGSEGGGFFRFVIYSSDFGTFPGGNSYNLALANMSVPMSIGPAGLLTTFIADVAGQFTGNFVSSVPAPASVVMYGFGMAGVGVLARWRRKRLATPAPVES
jgi:hypothetical protein